MQSLRIVKAQEQAGDPALGAKRRSNGGNMSPSQLHAAGGEQLRE
jgi:hypothetical protein